MNVGRTIDPAVQRVPDRVALVVGDRRCTYRELERWVGRIATALAAGGVGAGDRVALVDNGSVLSVATILAAARIGAASAQMNVELTVDELGRLVAAVGATVGVAGEPFRERLAGAIGSGALLGERDVDDVDGPQLSQAAGAVGDGDDEALVLFTSGTTGLPKPISISHGVVDRRLAFYAAPIDPDAPQVTDMMSAPIFHIGGTLGLLISLHSGNKLVVLPRFDAGSWLRAVEEHGVSQTFVVPTMLQRILDHPDFDSRDLSSLRQLSYGAAAAPVALVERALDALPYVGFVNVFGQTETLGAYAALSAEDHRRRHKLGSAGTALPGVELRIVDVAGADVAEDCAVGQVGEVWVRAAQNVSPDWLRTGDLASIDDEGYLHPVGRLRDTINRGGEKFGPIEVEEVLRAHPGVRDAGVTGVPDAEMGQRVGAVVVVDGAIDAADLRTFCAGRLARYKLPDWIVFADDLPYSNLGKVSRAALAAVILDAREEETAHDALHA
ncbi:MAG TPA: fatty acid--CoA ligase family protein [Acidimicrobiales bacterium]|nr:fatty acid--CoA ligase family protein [Acidimicrobiales bacterium]